MSKWTPEQLEEMKNLEGEDLLRYISEVIYNDNPDAYDYYTAASLQAISDADWDEMVKTLTVDEMMEKIAENPLVHVPRWEDLTEDQQADMMWRVQMAARLVQDERDSENS